MTPEDTLVGRVSKKKDVFAEKLGMEWAGREVSGVGGKGLGGGISLRS